MHFKLLLALPLSLMVACGDRGTGVQYGKTTKAALTAEKGAPASIEQPAPDQDLSVLVYPNDEKYQVQNDVVVAGFRKPSSKEKGLLYWRHRFKDCRTSFKNLAATNSHLKAEKELQCDAEGISVIYDPNIDEVTRIVERAHEE